MPLSLTVTPKRVEAASVPSLVTPTPTPSLVHSLGSIRNCRVLYSLWLDFRGVDKCAALRVTIRWNVITPPMTCLCWALCDCDTLVYAGETTAPVEKCTQRIGRKHVYQLSNVYSGTPLLNLTRLSKVSQKQISSKKRRKSSNRWEYILYFPNGDSASDKEKVKRNENSFERCHANLVRRLAPH